MFRRPSLIALAAAGLAACATSEDIVDITYAPPATAARTPGAESISVTVVGEDARTVNRGRIGSQINGYGMEMAAIRSEREVATVVQSALSAELGQRGYRLQPGGVSVRAAVDTFFNTFAVGMMSGQSTGRVQMTVTVADSGGQPLYRRTIAGEVQRSVMLANGPTAADSLSMALGQAIGTLFADRAFTAALAGTASSDPASRPAA